MRNKVPAVAPGRQTRNNAGASRGSNEVPLPIDKSKRDIEAFVAKVLAIDVDKPAEGRLLFFGPAPSLRRRGQSLLRIDWSAGATDPAQLVDQVARELERLSDSGDRGSLFVLAYRNGEDGFFEQLTARVVELAGEDPAAASNDLTGVEWLQRASGNAIQANTDMAKTAITGLFNAMGDLIGFAHEIGELKGQLQGAAQAATIAAQAEMAKAVLPHISEMVKNVSTAVAMSKAAGGDKELGEQPSELGEARLDWDLTAIEALVGDIQSHAIGAREGFTPAVRKRINELAAKAKMAAELVSQLPT